MAFYELRRYRVRPGRMDDWVRYMEEVIIPFQVARGMVIAGSFRGEEDDSTYVWLRRFESEAERERLYAAVYESDQWEQEISPRVGELIDRSAIEVTRLVATSQVGAALGVCRIGAPAAYRQGSVRQGGAGPRATPAGVALGAVAPAMSEPQAEVDASLRPGAAFRLGELEVQVCADVTFRLDGGMMYGTVPRVMWERFAVPDARNRVAVAARSMLVRGRDAGGAPALVLVDTGLGDLAAGARFRELYGVTDPAWRLLAELAALGVSPEAVTHVVLTHLHFDHAGGAVRGSGAAARPTFPAARYLVHGGELAYARSPDRRSQASYKAENWEPLAAAGVLDTVAGEDGGDSGSVAARRAGPHRPSPSGDGVRRRPHRAVHRRPVPVRGPSQAPLRARPRRRSPGVRWRPGAAT